MQRGPNSYDCIIHPGGTAHPDKRVTDLPVVDIHISVYDVLRTVKLARTSPACIRHRGFLASPDPPTPFAAC